MVIYGIKGLWGITRNAICGNQNNTGHAAPPINQRVYCLVSNLNICILSIQASNGTIRHQPDVQRMSRGRTAHSTLLGMARCPSLIPKLHTTEGINWMHFMRIIRKIYVIYLPYSLTRWMCCHSNSASLALKSVRSGTSFALCAMTTSRR